MRRHERLQKALIRLAAAMLCLFSLHEAWAGIGLYRGQRSFKQENYLKAFTYFEKSKKWNSYNPSLIYLLGQSAWNIGIKEKKPLWIETASLYFQKLTHQMPYYSRSWLYLALSRLAMEEQSEDRLTESEWKEIRLYLEKAYHGEPGSAWIHYMTGKSLLAQSQFLSEEEKKEALERIQKGIELHYAGQVSPYLDSALAFLWERFSDFEMLKKITPKDVFSYYRLIQFMDQNDLWPYRKEIYAAFLDFNEEAYLSQSRSAEKWLEKGKFGNAFQDFQKAFWVNQIFLRAKAGMLIVQQRTGNLPEDFRDQLKEILEEEEEDLRPVIPYLGPLVERSGDNYLKGLFAFRQNDFGKAKTYFIPSSPDPDRRFSRGYLAVSLWNTNEKDKALEIVQTVIAEKAPDLRELYLFKDWDFPGREKVLERIENLATLNVPGQAWLRKDFEGSSILDQRDLIGVSVHLKPGGAVISISLRGTPDANGIYGYILFRLWDRDRGREVASYYVNHREWKSVNFTVDTSGGSRWLQAELMNGAVDSKYKRGPGVEFGPVEIKPSL